MSRPCSKAIIVVSGLGNGVGVGAEVAKLFSKELGYRVALVSRPRKDVEDLAAGIKSEGGEAEVFSLQEYTHQEIKSVFDRMKAFWPDGRLKTAVWNTGQWSNIPFLDIAENDIKLSVQINVVAATAFSQEAVRMFTAPATGEGDEGAGGTLLVTGATSAWRGSHSFGAFAAGKHGLRAISQSIAREYGPQGVHVAFIVIDGTVLTKRTEALFGEKKGKGWLHDEGQALSPRSIAKTYLFLHQQSRDCWTLELDLRPAKEKF
ncbi:hypothetical protein BCR35DRAFT_308780 [Leucosporidium creatinivorum]|uniref:Short-chain dehydrogenase/reductase SDR n=1 Tax=Leucosporidium creatinivorum TaxID=106004 RepID=A0A1Y2DX25_9BASI|nr:hypothetical protein BCR35DRAFT_308780 [Leucosporidium creatinivorum]